MKTLRVALLFVAVAGLTVWSGPLAAKSIEGEKVEKIELPDLEEKKHAVPAPEATITLVDFWATWCKPCLVGMETLDKIHEKHKDNGLEIIAINLGESPKRVKRFLEKRDYDFTFLMGTDETAKLYGNVESIPRTFILDKEGKVLYDHEGLLQEKKFFEVVEKYLDKAEKPKE